MLPDLSQPVEPGPLAQRLGTALGVTLPDDFGTIQLMPADNLLAARTAVKAFDVIVVLLVILSVVLLALSLFLSRNRRHMIIYLAVGTFVAFLIARFAIRTIEDVLVGGIANLGVAGMVRTVMDATFEDLRGLTLLVLIGVAIVGIVAYLTGKPAWVSTATTAATSAASSAASRAGSAAAKPAPTPRDTGPHGPDAGRARGTRARPPHRRPRTRQRTRTRRPPRGSGPGAPYAPAATPSFSIRMAVALNSAVPDFGSVASIVSRLTATSSWKCMVMNVRPGPQRRVDPDRRPRPGRGARRPGRRSPSARP